MSIGMKNTDEKLVDWTATTASTLSDTSDLDIGFNPPKRRIRWKPRYEEERQRRIKAEQNSIRAFIMMFVFAGVAAMAANWGC